VNNPLDVKENDEHVLDFALHLSHLFSISASLDFLRRLTPCFWNACLIIARVSAALLFQDLHKI
jgi:hypothetical protein